MGVASEFVNFFQPTTRPTKTYFSYDFRVVWQSPRSCKLLQNLTTLRCHGRGREFESRRPRHSPNRRACCMGKSLSSLTFKCRIRLTLRLSLGGPPGCSPHQRKQR